MSKKRLLVNREFVDTAGEEFIDEFVNVKEALPNLLVNILEERDPDILTKRANLYREFPELEKADDDEIRIVLEMLKKGEKEKANDFQIQMALDFLDRYPQFENLILGVESQTAGFLRKVLSTIREAFVGEL